MAQDESRPEGASGAFKHGAFSKALAKRYADPETPEGKRWMEEFETDLIKDLGGQEEVSAAQRLLLCGIRARLQVIDRISAFVADREVVDGEGRLIPCLRGGFTTYMEGLRRDLQALYDMAKKRPVRPPSLHDLMKESGPDEAGKDEDGKP